MCVIKCMLFVVVYSDNMSLTNTSKRCSKWVESWLCEAESHASFRKRTDNLVFFCHLKQCFTLPGLLMYSFTLDNYMSYFAFPLF
jgi:hypothetical protein